MSGGTDAAAEGTFTLGDRTVNPTGCAARARRTCGSSAEAGADLSAQHTTVTTVAARHEATPAHVRLAWTLHRGQHVLAIPGTGDPAHLAENVAAAALRLTAEDVAALDGA
jgi:pyridoxine 4-dehydrogenase